MKKWLKKFSESKAREGYFVLFFAMLITMLMLPIMNQVLLETIETRSGITQYQKTSDLLTLGNSALRAKLEELSRDKGLGYYESKEVPLRDGVSLSYEYSAASTKTVPSSYSLNDLYGILGEPVEATVFSCEELLESGEISELDPTSQNCRLPGDRTPVANYYTVPALGTGSAGGEDCSLNEVPQEKYSVEGGDWIDPLDHPCNWNTLAKGENITLPFYVQPPELAEDENKYQVHKPDMMLLRVRLKCADGSDFCDPGERLEFWDDEMLTGAVLREDGSVEEVNFIDIEKDFTLRVFDWLLKEQEVYVPLMKTGVAGEGESGRVEGQNEEITALKLRNNARLGEFHDFSLYDVEEKIALVDFNKIENANILEESDLNYAGVLNLFMEALGFEGFGPWRVSEFMPEFIFGFTKNEIEGCESDTAGDEEPSCSGNQSDVYELEYQFVMSEPVGNDKYVLKGVVKTDLGEEYILQEIDKRGPESASPGAVFNA